MHLIYENYYLDSNILDTPTSPKERISHKELYAAYKSSKSHPHAERSSISIPVKESGSSPIMHSTSPSAPLLVSWNNKLRAVEVAHGLKTKKEVKALHKLVDCNQRIF